MHAIALGACATATPQAASSGPNTPPPAAEAIVARDVQEIAGLADYSFYLQQRIVGV